MVEPSIWRIPKAPLNPSLDCKPGRVPDSGTFGKHIRPSGDMRRPNGLTREGRPGGFRTPASRRRRQLVAGRAACAQRQDWAAGFREAASIEELDAMLDAVLDRAKAEKPTC